MHVVGKYYLGDTYFMFKPQVLTPYLGVWYHLKEYSQRGPQKAHELFNYRHSSLRNVIERIFDFFFKKQFSIIASRTKLHYSLNTTTNIVLACCIFYNFLRRVDINKCLLEEFDRDLMEEDINVSHSQTHEDDYRIMSHIRDIITNQMWAYYSNN